MASTHFTTGTTITSEWLNDVNDAVYEGNITAEGVQYTPPFTGAVATNVEAKLAQTVSVKDFGAVGDGVTDDTAAIQAAINAISDNTILQIHGDFVLTNNLYMVAKNNIVLDFTGSKISNSKGCLLYLQACESVVIQGISEYAASTTDAGTSYDPSYVPPSNFLSFAIMAYLCQQVTIQNNNMNLSGALPIAIEQGNGHAMLNNKVSNGGDNTLYMYNVGNSIISNNLVSDTVAGRAICIQRGAGCVVSGNTVDGGAGFGISLVGTATTTVAGNTIKDIAFDSVVLSSQAGISIEGNENADVTSAELTAANANLYLFNGAYSRNCVVSGNDIHNCGTGVLVGLGPQGNYGVNKIVGNIITLSAASGMTLINNRGPLSINANKIRTCQNAGILFQGQSEQTVIDGNEIEDVNIAAFGYTAIHKDAGVTSMLSLSAGSNSYYGSATRTNFTYAEMQNSDYQQGTWTPTDASAQGLVFTVTTATYTRVGRQVTVIGDITYPVTANANVALIGGLPFTLSSNCPAATMTDVGSSMTVMGNSGATTAYVYTSATLAAQTNAQLSGKFIRFSMTYFI